MRGVAFGFLVGTLILGGLTLPAEAGGRHHKHHGHHHRHHGHFRSHGPGHFVGGFLAGAATVLVVDALHPPRVVYQPDYYRTPVCRNTWVPGRWEVRPRTDNGFTTYYHVWVQGHWSQRCS